MKQPIVVIGSGGHAVVVADALLASGSEVIGFTDSNPTRHGETVLGLRVLGGDDALAAFDRDSIMLANGIGATRVHSARRAAGQRLAASGWRFATVLHPGAIVARSAILEEGAQLLAGSIVQPGAHIGTGAIVNTAAVVEHHARVGAWSHVAPQALLCGAVQIGSSCHIGAGAVVIQNIALGDSTLVAAGAVVVRDYEGGGTLVGVPAHPASRG